MEIFPCGSAPLPSTSKVLLRELHLKRIIVFSDIIGHLRSSICLAPSPTVASLIYMGTRRTLLNLKPGLHVLRSRKPLHCLAAKTDKLFFIRRPTLQDVFCVKEETLRGTLHASGFDVRILSPSLTCFNSLLDEFTLHLFGSAS